MNIHSNAGLTAYSREQIVRRCMAGETPLELAMTRGVSPAAVHEWIRCYKVHGREGLKDRLPRPHRMGGFASGNRRSCPRLACSEVLPGETRLSAMIFLRNASFKPA